MFRSCEIYQSGSKEFFKHVCKNLNLTEKIMSSVSLENFDLGVSSYVS